MSVLEALHHVYTIKAILFVFAHESRRPSQKYLDVLLRRNLLCKNAKAGYSLTPLGIALVKRHEDQFKQLHLDYLAEQEEKHKPTGRRMSEAQRQALTEGRARWKAEQREANGRTE